MSRQSFRTSHKNARRNPVFAPTLLDNVDNKKFQQTEKEIIKKVNELKSTEGAYNVAFRDIIINILPYLAFQLPQYEDHLLISKAYYNFIKDKCETDDPKDYHEGKLRFKDGSEFSISVDYDEMLVSRANASVIIPFPMKDHFSGDMSLIVYQLNELSPKECLKQLLIITFRSYVSACYKGKRSFACSDLLGKDINTPLATPFFIYLTAKWLLETLKKFGIFIGYIPKPINITAALDHFMPETSAYFNKVIKTGGKLSDFDETFLMERDMEYITLCHEKEYQAIGQIAENLNPDQKKTLMDAFLKSMREERTRLFLLFERSSRINYTDEIMRSPLFIESEALLYLEEEKLNTARSETKDNKPEEDTVPRTRYEAIKKQLVENNNEFEKLEEELNKTKEALAEEKEKSASAKETSAPKPESSPSDNLLLKDQYDIVRELALLRQENAKLKRQIALRDKLEIAPEKKEMLEQIESFCETVPRETKIEFLNTKDIIIVGGEKNNLVNALRKAGITAKIDEKYDDGKIKAKYDIYVCLIKKMSHSLDDQTTRAAKSNNGVLLYFDYMNAERLIDEMYEACMNKLDK